MNAPSRASIVGWPRVDVLPIHLFVPQDSHETHGYQSMNMKPPIIPLRTTSRPYLPPKPKARAWIRAGATLLLDAVEDDPPKPVKVLLAEVLAEVLAVLDEPPPLEVAVAAVVDIVEVFTRVGF